MIAALVACGPAPPPTALPPQPLDADALLEVTREITDLGARMVATPAEEDATALMEALFLEAGLHDVHREPFVWDAWVPGPASIEVGGAVLSAVPLSPTPATAGLSAPLVLEGTDVAGGLVVVTDEGTSRGVQALSAATSGAAGMIRVTEATADDGDLLVEVGHTLIGLQLPSVAVDAAVGAELRAHIGETATLSADTLVVADHTSYNVVGSVPGTGPGTVYVTAHHDSWNPSESAADNAIGVGALVLLARRLADGPAPGPTVVFVATGAEEQGLRGALAYTDQHPEAEDAQLVLNLDVLWASEGVFVVMSSEPRWTTTALTVADGLGLSAVDGGLPDPSSDNFAFQILGAPAFWSGRFGYREYHTHRDTLDTLDFTGASDALRVQWAVLADEVGVPR
ncbi:MAG: M28 family peptidase [Myxococcota bacterium]